LIEKKPLIQDLEALAPIGALPEGGVTRLAFSPQEVELHRLVASWLAQLGGEVRKDAIGNLIARWPGQDDSLPAIAFGSHLDSVPQGGKFDGVVGVVAALAAIRAIRKKGLLTKHPLEVIVFVGEESSRFGVATLGSKAMAGLGNIEQYLKLKDAAGVTLESAASSSGAKLAEIKSAIRQPKELKAFLEVHIEQGRVLEESANKIGVVTAIAAPTRRQIIIEGRADHSGAAPMDLRRDALTAAAELILAVEHYGRREAAHKSVSTVGVLTLEPGAMNVIPGQVELGIDIRDIDKNSKDLAVSKVISLLEDVARKREVKVDYEILADEAPVTLSGKIINTLEKAAQALGYPYRLMPSGAGHDAMYMAEVAQTGMIFVPSREGISHNIAEYTPLEDIARGTEVLLEAVLQLADEE